MPLGSKAKYTAAQKRKAARIEESYEHKGVPKDEVEARCLGHREQAVRRGRKGRRPGSAQSAGQGKPRTGKHQPSVPRPPVRATHAAAALRWRPRLSESLLKEARAKDIPGRSSMRKDQLISHCAKPVEQKNPRKSGASRCLQVLVCLFGKKCRLRRCLETLQVPSVLPLRCGCIRFDVPLQQASAPSPGQQ